MSKATTLLLGLVMLSTALLSLQIGSAPIPLFSGLLDWFTGQDSLAGLVIGEIRLPRTLLALVVGAALGFSGAALQGLLRNPLADPALTGASSGAALGAATVFYYGLLGSAGALAPTLAGLIGAGVALLLMLALAGTAKASMVIMAGLAISTLTGALLATVLNFAPNPFAMQELVFWLLGSVSERGLDTLVISLPPLLAGALLVWSQRRLLLGLSLGEAVAESMGLSIKWGSRITVLGVALLVGSAVALAGNIGFVGLIVPHLIRPLVGYRPDRLLLPSALAGASLVCLADICVRLLPPGQELKLGVITSLLGAPLFIWLVWKERGRWQ